MASGRGEQKQRNLRGTWPQALIHLGLSILIILSLRWALFEPYVIPSGSMIPTLLINDHILVNKFSYGLRLPFSSIWLWRWRDPKVGEVVVFRSLEQDDVYLVKRVVAVSGDRLEVVGDSHLTLNKEPAPHIKFDQPRDKEKWFAHWPEVQRQEFEGGTELENLNGVVHLVRSSSHRGAEGEPQSFDISKNHFFAMGDHRDRSSDSRVFGEVPMDRILGRASLIWLSCDETLPESPNICNPLYLRGWRMFRWIE